MEIVGDRPSTIVQDEEAELVRKLFGDFLEMYTVDEAVGPQYLAEIQIMVEQLGQSVYINYEHLNNFDIALCTAIESEYYRFEPHLRMAAQAVIKKHHAEYITLPSGAPREFWIHFYNLASVLRLRELRTGQIGRLVSVCGTVTRTSEVRPELLFGTFVCLDCQTRVPDVEQRFKYTEPLKCANPVCANTNRWQLDVDASKFVDWQKVRVQENANEIPSGAMPRTLEVILRQDAVEKAKAGDRCTFTGTLIVVPDLSAVRLPGAIQAVREISKNRDIGEGEGIGGLKGLGVRELTYRLAFLASSVAQSFDGTGGVNIRDDNMDDDNPQSVAQQFSEEERKKIYLMRQDPNLYTNLVQSVAPAIYGHDEVKKGILLMLFGGVHKETREGIRLRGDINVCIVGDPSVAKSQFLKYVTGIVPRSVYTAGKASSAAGLTATVVRDADTGDFNIEAGALMLADNGICCIDEFDKMDPADQVAIHEAMEQQTISIAKAGIHATLNARTSILAAANPIGGRYDRTKSLRANLTITPAIMSRFDLMFVVLDKNDPVLDEIVATHIVSVHQKKDRAINAPYTTADVQRYIKFARSLKPEMSAEASSKLVEEYCQLRAGDQSRGKTAWRITVRQLESLVRLSEALARLHLEPVINKEFVQEAARLLRQSIVNIQMEDVELLAPPPMNDDVGNLLNTGSRDDDDDDGGGAGGAGGNGRGRPSPSAGDDASEFARPLKRAKTSDLDSLPSHPPSQPTPDSVRVPEESLEATQPLEALPDATAARLGSSQSIARGGSSNVKKPPVKRTTRITREQFDRITRTLLIILRTREESLPDDPAMKQRELVAQYLEVVAEELTSEDAIKERRDIVRAAIEKLITSDKLLRVLPSIEKQSKEDRLIVADADRSAQILGDDLL